MARDLLAEFDRGRADHLDGITECPFMATSDAADAWHSGAAYERHRPSVYGPSKVTKGRGYRVNVLDGVGHPRPSSAPRFTYRVEWDGRGAPNVVREA